MNLDEFESHYRTSLEASLNQLQSVNLLIDRLKLTVDGISQNLYNLTSSFEEHIGQREDEANN